MISLTLTKRRDNYRQELKNIVIKTNPNTLDSRFQSRNLIKLFYRKASCKLFFIEVFYCLYFKLIVLTFIDIRFLYKLTHHH